MSTPSSGSAAPVQVKAAKGQPSGLWVLFITEMWERFAYYGMRALLVYFLASKLTAANPGFGWSESEAQDFYGWFVGIVYLTPILGGWIADKFLGTHRSMLTGGWIIAAGEMCLFLTEYWGRNPAWEEITLGTAPAQFLTFMGGLVLIVIGTGFFKPCVSVMVGQLYGADDPRRDSGFTIFYMGINLGALLSGLVAGTLGEKIGWHWGFGSAAVGMTLGLIVYQFVRPFYLKGIGLPPHHKPEHEEGHEPTPEEIEQARIDEYERTRPLTRVDWDRIIVIVVLSVFAIAFWVSFEQAGTSLALFALNRTDRCVLGFEFPATWYQSVNPAAIVLLAPLFAGLWSWLAKRGWQPSTPVKFAIGLTILSVAYLPMVFGSLQAGNPKPIALEAAPEPVQKVLQPVLSQLEKEIAEAEAKKNAQEDKEKKSPSFLKKLLSVFVSQDKKPKEADFDLLEELTHGGHKYYAVGYTNQQATVYELLGDDGKLLRRQAACKGGGEDRTLQEVHEAKPRKIALEQIPEEARKTILAQVGSHKIRSLTSQVVAKEPIDTIWNEKDGREFEKTHFRRIRDFTATWGNGDGESTVKVDEGGVLLTKTVRAFEDVGMAGPYWLLLIYVLATCGELCLSPVGLSMVTKLSPARYTALLMGLFFVTIAIANKTSGSLASASEDIAAGKWFTILGGQVDFFLVLAIVPLVISIIVFLLSPTIKRMMHGLH